MKTQEDRVNARSKDKSQLYNIGDRVKFVNYNLSKLDSHTHGPYQLSQHVQDTVNARKIFHYHE